MHGSYIIAYDYFFFLMHNNIDITYKVTRKRDTNTKKKTDKIPKRSND